MPTPSADSSRRASGCGAVDRGRSDAGLLNVGIGTGDKRKQMLCLRVDEELVLVVGSRAVPLAELVDYRDGGYS